jgi:hypothetical protein
MYTCQGPDHKSGSALQKIDKDKKIGKDKKFGFPAALIISSIHLYNFILPVSSPAKSYETG